MSDRELDVQMAELMGWIYWDSDFRDYDGEYPMYIVLDALLLVYDEANKHREFSPSTDIAAAWLVEERIEELGLIEEYCMYLNEVANAHWDRGKRQPQRWQLIHATPEDRCRAALMAVEAE